MTTRVASAPAWTILLLLTPVLGAQTPDPPLVQEGKTIKVSEHVWVIPDGRVNLVPNIGIVTGRKATLVIDSGMGSRNGAATLREVRKISPTAPLYLTATHFHPEHVTGFQAFPANALLAQARVQQDELASSMKGMIGLFSKMSATHAALLKDIVTRRPDLVFGDSLDIDLGGVTVQLFTIEPAHTRGDTFALVKEDAVLFGGDIITNRFFPIILEPYGTKWIRVLDELAKRKATKIVPGHGEVADQSLISRERAFLALMQARTQELKRQGKSIDETASLVTKELQAKYADWGGAELLSGGVRRFYADASPPKP